MNELDIREELLNLIDNDPSGEDSPFAKAKYEAVQRNAFCIRPDPDGPIFTVTITHGGSLTS